ncbi:MAG: hypothetical protein K0Q72_4343 [Armatimonadetes bacterium]|jgi:hypothetical protein|nr:hypothetical protein [Armatimonadota bacterium]
MHADTVLQNSDPDGVGRLISDLIGPDENASAWAGAQLVARGEAVVPTLCGVLNLASPTALTRVLKVLARIRSLRASEPLRHLLADWVRVEDFNAHEPLPEPVRTELVDTLLQALYSIDPTGNVRAFGVGMVDRAPKIRTTAAELLERSGSAGRTVLCQVLNGSSAEGRLEAAWSLRCFADRVAVSALCEGLRTNDPNLLVACMQALYFMARYCPTPDLRLAVPRLKTLRRLRIWESPALRETAQQTLQQIEAATQTLQDVPVSGAEPLSASEALPLPSTADPAVPDAAPEPVTWSSRLRAWMGGGPR